MFEVTHLAQEKILQRLAAEGKTARTLRVRIIGWTAEEFEYRLEVLSGDQLTEDDVVVEEAELTVALASDSAERLNGARLDYVDKGVEQGFKIDNPNPVWTDARTLAVQKVIDKHINPGVAVHGGRVKLLDVKDDVAYVEFDGGCKGCGLSTVTLKQGVVRMLRERVPEIREVIDTTDHAAGTNPYYKPQETHAAGSPLAQ